MEKRIRELEQENSRLVIRNEDLVETVKELREDIAIQKETLIQIRDSYKKVREELEEFDKEWYFGR